MADTPVLVPEPTPSPNGRTEEPIPAEAAVETPAPTPQEAPTADVTPWVEASPEDVAAVEHAEEEEEEEAEAEALVAWEDAAGREQAAAADEVEGEEALLIEEALLVEEAPAAEEERPPRRIREDGELPHERFDYDAVKVVTRLHQFGHQAYFVGGCVRDLILGRTPKDFDIATSATPNQVRGIFRNCRLIGRRFRLAHVYFKGGKIIEVSTFRANPLELEEAGNGGAEAAEEGQDDLLVTDDNVFGSAEEDARRRDFTMNGLFYDVVSGRVLDYVRGRRDLDRREIRTIGDPEVRMREDPVRILRAVRFAGKLGLDIESRTYAAMEGAVEDLQRCAPARLLEETFRLLRGGSASSSLHLLAALDALRVLLPPLGSYLRERGHEGAQVVRAFAEALDRRVHRGEQLDDALLLAALLVPVSRQQPVQEPEGGPPAVAQVIEDHLDELVQKARLPRRIAERCRMVLSAQRTLTGERRRRGSQASFRRHPIFEDALKVFEMTAEATGEFVDEMEAWKAGGAPTPKESAEGPRRRRRRRSGRGRGPRPAGEEGSTPDSVPSPPGRGTG
ncbi:MAG: polynucleotide adenylyltransferase PcnB [Myxococcaceae bacterium]|nr:polynucleotide adenylyltransferase PcnB [Myxococcaceae bacterium]